jgi:single-strand DNA-binding protein
MNLIIIMGRLTRDPAQSDSGETKITKFCVAVDRRYTGGEQKTDFFNITTFGRTAEFAEKYLHKGVKVVVTGRVVVDTYTAKDGTKKTAYYVIADTVEFAESKAAAQDPENQAKPAPVDNDFIDVPDNIGDLVPFK